MSKRSGFAIKFDILSRTLKFVCPKKRIFHQRCLFLLSFGEEIDSCFSTTTAAIYLIQKLTWGSGFRWYVNGHFVLIMYMYFVQ